MVKSIDMKDNGSAYAKMFIPNYKNTTMVTLEYLIDTGASVTTISKEVLVNQLGYSYEWIENNRKEVINEKPFRDASDREIKKYYVLLSGIKVLGKTLDEWPFFIRIEDDLDFSNLLGMSALSHFNITFDSENGLVLFKYVNNPKIQVPKYGGQIIKEINDATQ